MAKKRHPINKTIPEQLIKYPNFDVSGVALTTLLGIMQMYPFCKHGSEIPYMFASVGDLVYDSDWYKRPAYQQRYFQMVIAISHVPRKVSGYGIVDCNYETYMKVTHFSLFWEENPLKHLSIPVSARLWVLLSHAEERFEIKSHSHTPPSLIYLKNDVSPKTAPQHLKPTFIFNT